MLEINHMPRIIELGFVGETNFRPIEIDMTAWMQDLPNGVPSIVCVRPRESEALAFIAATEFADNILRWAPSAGEIGPLDGNGMIQIWLEEMENDTVNKRGKSVIVETVVHASMPDASADIPEAQESWMEQMTELKVATVQAAEDAADSAEAAALSADAAALSADRAGTFAGQAQTARQGASSSALAAAGSAETARQMAANADASAEQALEYKNAAADSASDAADSASDAADSAQEAADKVGLITEEAQQAVTDIGSAVSQAEQNINTAVSGGVSQIETAIDAAPEVIRIRGNYGFNRVTVLDRTEQGHTYPAYETGALGAVSEFEPEEGDYIMYAAWQQDYLMPASPADLYVSVNINDGTIYVKRRHIRLSNVLGATYPVGTVVFEKNRYYMMRYTGTSRTVADSYIVYDYEILDFAPGATPETKAAEAAASSSASAAAASALVSEGYAVGTQNGTPVSSDSQYSGNNAKYHAEAAAQSATDANNAKQAIEDMTVSATPLAASATPTATKTTDQQTGVVNIEYGLVPGTTYTPSVSGDGTLSFTNDGNKTNPAAVNIAEQVRGVFDEIVTGTDPVIVGVGNHRYLCGEVATIDITPSATGVVDVIFTSGTTPAVLTLPAMVQMPDWFDAADLAAETVYEINIADGVWGAVMMWAL